jgi:hypothetical protein
MHHPEGVTEVLQRHFAWARAAEFIGLIIKLPAVKKNLPPGRWNEDGWKPIIRCRSTDRDNSFGELNAVLFLLKE